MCQYGRDKTCLKTMIVYGNIILCQQMTISNIINLMYVV